jgi:MoxR-like ATPase
MQTGTPTNEPTVIDEINRADIDKAFGQLFTTLSGQTVTIPYVLKDYPDEEIQISIASDTRLPIDPSQFVVPSSWRIFGTMNTFDKTSLHELSYAFMRRFSFIRIGVPTIPETEDELVTLIGEFARYWGVDKSDDRTLQEVGRVWRQTNIAVEQRSIGPAIVRDILLYITQHEDDGDFQERLTEAVVSYIFPQLEGVPERDEIVRQIGNNTAVNRDEIDRAAKDMLSVSAFDSN